VNSDETASESDSRGQRDDVSNEFAEAFNQPDDPLAQYSKTFHELPDPFELFISNVLQNRETIETQFTIDNYRRDYRQWTEHMDATTDNRHPACPNVRHVKSFIRWQRDVRNNSRRTIKAKLSRLSQAYEYWQAKPELPHPNDYNPFVTGRKETDLGDDKDKQYPDLPLSTLRQEFRRVNNIRRRGIIGLQLKQGARAGEVCNLKISELHLSHQDIQDQYSQLGTHPAIGDYSDVVYIPHDRTGNKSSNSRLLPLDGELRWLLIRHLLTRPQVNEPWVFLSKRTFTKMNPNGVTKEWKAAFYPEYGETEEQKGLTSHFGRHWFSSWFRLEVGMQREHVQYMRGDRVQPTDEFSDAIDEYLHPNYEHIEKTYRRNIFRLNISQKHADL